MMAMLRKAIAIDLDGTLLRSDRTISEYNQHVIRRCAECGWVVIFSTARPPRTITRLLPEDFHRHYWTACNGAWIIKDGEILARNEIAEDAAGQLIDLFRQQDYRISIEAADKLYSNNLGSNVSFIGPTYQFDDFTPQPICKILIDATHHFDEAFFRSLLPNECRYVITDNGQLVQLAADNCDKLLAVQSILELEGIPFEDLIAFGDDNNDIPLLSAAGLGIAMGNATPQLKAVANLVTRSNDEDGVGWQLEQLLRSPVLPS